MAKIGRRLWRRSPVGGSIGGVSTIRGAAEAGSRRWWGVTLWSGLAFWLVGFGWHWWRPGSLWLLDLVAVPLMAMLLVAGLTIVVVAAVGGRRRVVLLTVVPVLIVLSAVVAPLWRVAPKTWFALHRPLYEWALATDPGTEYYGAELPLPLGFLSEGGRVSDLDGGRFFPQWIGIPDDAGGYVFDPEGSPAGADLYGMSCADPVDLGGGWWMCGLAPTGF